MLLKTLFLSLWGLWAVSTAVAQTHGLRDCAECPELLRLPAGAYRMGSPVDEPGHDHDEDLRHNVRIPAFAIGRTEVTVAQYQACVDAGACAPPAWQNVAARPALFAVLGDSVAVADHPVTGVSWHMAQAYAAWLGQRTGQRYHLPSETQWEYAARAGTLTRWSSGDDVTALADHAWFTVNSGQALHPVASRRANPWGLHDAHGSVWEWTQDCYEHWGEYDHWDPRWDAAPHDQRAWEGGRCLWRVMRGGSWRDGPERLRSAERAFNAADHATQLTGFRIARELP